MSVAFLEPDFLEPDFLARLFEPGFLRKFLLQREY